jgi:hypothetical protein
MFKGPQPMVPYIIIYQYHMGLMYSYGWPSNWIIYNWAQPETGQTWMSPPSFGRLLGNMAITIPICSSEDLNRDTWLGLSILSADVSPEPCWEDDSYSLRTILTKYCIISFPPWGFEVDKRCLWLWPCANCWVALCSSMCDLVFF